MPRKARVLGTSGYVHVIARGNGKQIIFEDSEDFHFYLVMLKKYSEETGVGIVAYCLMDNHIHLLLNISKGNLPTFMKKIGVTYSLYFNGKYERVGHLFQNRYKSEPILDERHFLTVLRYILRNPTKAGISKPERYPWSSYHLYWSGKSEFDTQLVEALLGSPDAYERFMQAEPTDYCLEHDTNEKSDEWAIAYLQNHFHISSGTVLQSYPREKRNESLKKLRLAGMSIRQIERLTGINRGVIYKASKVDKRV